ncbi:hypothetical protein HanRHA438_Chr07g0298861 [Helianthus annuus]|nr:hypothetical protein HanIR_Chr07g0311051 [Helianthus annuus]KAJ0907429.1 hypothetical protein HanRHA438_Chr07g0298861 [Helianthus annuus]
MSDSDLKVDSTYNNQYQILMKSLKKLKNNSDTDLTLRVQSDFMFFFLRKPATTIQI